LLFQQYQNLRDEIRKGAGRLVGESREMCAIREEIDRVAGSDCTVLLTGETGTGKDLIAREIHDRSGRRDNMFVNVGCDIPRELAESELFGHERGAFTGAAARRRGLFALSDRGTLFLNDIAKLPKEVQGKLLRAVEEGTIRPVGSGNYIPVDFRLIAATSRDLEAAVRDGEFLEDLYFRLKVVHIHVPPLRERLDDVPPLGAHFLDEMTGKMNRPRCRLSWQAMERLRGYHWPGNVRELKNTLENALVHWDGEVLGEELFLGLPGSAADRESFKARLNRLFREIEKREILLVLRECKFNVAEAARRTGFTREGLRKKMKRLGITRPDS
ncbi:MAG: sigma-54 dependent transcriptional regulator, partial [bacterium]